METRIYLFSVRRPTNAASNARLLRPPPTGPNSTPQAHLNATSPIHTQPILPQMTAPWA